MHGQQNIKIYCIFFFCNTEYQLTDFDSWLTERQILLYFEELKSNRGGKKTVFC